MAAAGFPSAEKKQGWKSRRLRQKTSESKSSAMGFACLLACARAHDFSLIMPNDSVGDCRRSHATSSRSFPFPLRLDDLPCSLSARTGPRQWPDISVPSCFAFYQSRPFGSTSNDREFLCRTIASIRLTVRLWLIGFGLWGWNIRSNVMSNSLSRGFASVF